MKAAIIEDTGKLSVKSVSHPNVGDYDVLCETQYGAVCTGTDTHLLQGHEPFCHWFKMPAILGHESVGKVVETGAKVKHLKLGDLVTRVGHPGDGEINSAWGGFSQTTIGKDWQAMKDDGLEESEWLPHRVNRALPTGVDAATGTMFITWRETLSYIKRLGAGSAASVLVIGSGSNGLAMANHAVNLQVPKVVLVGSSNRKNEVQRIGCHAFVDYKAGDAGEQALALSPQGFDIVVDVIGTPMTSNHGLSCIADQGRMGIYGMDNKAEIKLPIGLANNKTFTLYQGAYDEAEVHDEVCDYVLSEQLDASVWIDKAQAFELDDIHYAFKAVEARSLVKPLIKLS